MDGSDKGPIWVGLSKDFGPQGYAILANFKVKNNVGNVTTGIFHSIEEWSIKGIADDEITSEVRFEDWDDCKKFSWKVRERSDDKTYERVFWRFLQTMEGKR